MADPSKTSRRRPPAAAADPDPIHDLSYNEARTALELSLAQLQGTDLEVEAMVGLYRRAEAYAQRCEQLLDQVEQEVRLWSSNDPDNKSTPYAP